uniref:Solute carrier family 29 member 2 n=1 Tax=Esox lucius TaxID=8010 RepID=A0A6Q2Y2S7_ESOLU
MKVWAETPRDRGWLVGIIFFILGLGTLLPWNFFMTASMYFNSRLNKAELSNGTVAARKEYYFDNWMTLLSQLPVLLCTLLNSFFYQRIPEMVRLAGSMIFIFLLFVLTAILVKIPMEEDRFFTVTMVTIWFINSFGAVLQGSLFGLVGQLPQKYSTLFMSGQGLAGTFAAIAMLISIASDTDPETAALGYFITPCVGTLVTLICYLLLPRLVSDSVLPEYKRASDQTHRLGPNDQANGHPPHLAASDEMVEGTTETTPNQAFVRLEPAGDRDKSSVMEVFKKIWVKAFCVTFVFTITLAVFPAITVDVKTKFLGKWEPYFIPVCCFLLFNVGDWMGRTVTSLVQWPPKESRLLPVLVVSRVVFVPLLMLCNVQKRSHLPVLFNHDAIFTIFMALFSLSSGYCVCLSMSYAPQLVAPKDAETAGALMTFFLALGLSLGAALSFLLRLLV